MIRYYYNDNGTVKTSDDPAMAGNPAVFWYDILPPSSEDEALIEQALGIDLPTREEMAELEISSRLYEDNGLCHATVSSPAEREDDINSINVTFIVSKNYLITLRYEATKVIRAHGRNLARRAPPTPDMLAASILGALVDYGADLLEKEAAMLDALGKQIFASTAPRRRSLNSFSVLDWRKTLQDIGQNGQKMAVIRECFVSFSRMTTFLITQSDILNLSKEAARSLRSSSRDSQELAEHATYLSSKVTFLLEAALGMLNVEQNQIIKLFSVVAVVLMPPTLVASIYGMNFRFMPELEWQHGYPFAVVLMVISAVLPFVYFRLKKWL